MFIQPGLAFGLGAFQERRIQAVKQGDEVGALSRAQRLVEEEVVDVKQRITGHKDGHVGIAGLFVDGEELFFGAGADDKAVCAQPAALVL